MRVLSCSLALVAYFSLAPNHVIAHKHHKLVIGGAAAGGAGAVGGAGGFLAGSHIGALLARHGFHGHGPEKAIILPPKHIYLKHGHHHIPVEKHIAPIHAGPVHPHPPIHVAPVHPPIHVAPVPVPEHVHHGHEHLEAPIPIPEPISHGPVFPSHSPFVVKKAPAVYKGNLVVKKLVHSPGHHFAIHGYQFSLGRKPTTVFHKKHFLFHPSPVLVKHIFVKEPAAAPIIKVAAEAPSTAGHGEIVHEAHSHHVANPILLKGANVVESGPVVEQTAPILKILRPIFDAQLPIINAQETW